MSDGAKQDFALEESETVAYIPGLMGNTWRWLVLGTGCVGNGVHESVSIRVRVPSDGDRREPQRPGLWQSCCWSKQMVYVFLLPRVFLYWYDTRLSYLKQCDKWVRSKVICLYFMKCTILSTIISVVWFVISNRLLFVSIASWVVVSGSSENWLHVIWIT